MHYHCHPLVIIKIIISSISISIIIVVVVVIIIIIITNTNNICVFAVSEVLAQEASAAAQSSSRSSRPRNCTVCKRPLRGHHLLLDCPKNQNK